MGIENFDVVVVGGGPGGYVAAIRSAQLGKKVALVEREHLGGICLNWGCIPTKALLRSSELLTQIREANKYGINVENVSFDLDAIVKRSRQISGQLNSGIGHLLKKNKVKVFEGQAVLTAPGALKVEPAKGAATEIKSKDIILATGARSRAVPGIDIDGKNVWSYKEALVPSEMPSSLLVVGSGAIGMEFACFYNHLGADVTVVEMLPKILPNEDDEVSAYMQKSLAKQGIKFYTSSTISSMKSKQSPVSVMIDDGNGAKEHTFDKVISAVGVVPNTEKMGLEAVGVALDEKGFINTDNQGKTSVPGIWAIGDVAGPPCLAHKASHEGIICAEVISGKTGLSMPGLESIPGCTYTHPQVASIGLSEQRAKQRGLDIRIGRFPFGANGKALALGESEGFVKTIFDAKTGELLGAHMVGAEVTEMIQGFCVGKELETTEEELLHTVFPHPTLSEMMPESVLDAFGRAIHI